MKKIILLLSFVILGYSEVISNVKDISGEDIEKVIECKKSGTCNEDKKIVKKENYKSSKAKPKKVVTSNVLDDYQEGHVDENICKAFISQNKNRAYDNGYQMGKRVVKRYLAKVLLKYDKELSTLFPIESMYIENILEPPVIKEYKDEFILDNGTAYKAYEKKYKIVQRSKFVKSSEKKSWKTFLLDGDPKYYINSKIDTKFTFKTKLSNNKECNDKIISISKESFKRGLKDGKDEAILLYKSRLQQLYKYMDSLYLYYRLYIERKLDPPIVGKINTAVSSNKKSLVIDENFYKILEPAKFNDDVKKWRVFLIEHSKLKEIK